MLNMAEGVARLGALAESPVVAALGRAFADAGHDLAIVGGPVRDALLGRAVHDLDFTTDARPDDILRIVKPISTAQWDIGRAFGTIGAKVRGEQVEITTYRADSYNGVTRKPTVEFGDTLEGDLVRRDFTVNSMALRVPARTLVDPTGGVEDLVARRLRTPAAADISFGDDPLRMLRAARFASQLDFAVDPATVTAMEQLRATLAIVSPERIQGELVRLLQTDDPVIGIRLLVETGLIDGFLPEVPALKLEVDEHHHHKDVYEHSLTVLRQTIELEKTRNPVPTAPPPDADASGGASGRVGPAAPDVPLRLAALLHDIGKPATRKLEPGGGVTFYHHDIKGARLARKRLQALRFDSDTIGVVTRLIELHLRFFGYSEGAWTDAAVRRYVRDAGDELDRLHILTRADVTTRNAKKAGRLARAYDDIERRIAELSAQEELAAMRPEVDGNRIQELLGIGPGREVGEAYRFLLDLRLDEGILGVDEAERRLLAWWAARS
ncbi:CCA tRNA nucleotidyltransferase [Microbacterium sp. Root166]|uniref:CCA tRNA nucleotidyltransferase n=1 Tax=Microbacterium sp. Root166 TaxID=1736478 RepID=UPI0006FC7318|nr:CCA tRNA nucleotidyltransferase [Microbacterium sp. Root166]KQZ85605.1 CCA tRNA nucleotidyltransferase [Microbacterium sp. Root166]